MSSQLPAMSSSVENFLAELAIQRRASPHTLDAYRRDLARLTALAAGSSLPALKTPQLRRGLMQLHAQELAPRSIARTLSAWRSYYTWLARRGVIALNPADGLRAPKRARALPKALGIDQARQGDSGKNADDGDDDHQLDKREATRNRRGAAGFHGHGGFPFVDWQKITAWPGVILMNIGAGYHQFTPTRLAPTTRPDESLRAM